MDPLLTFVLTLLGGFVLLFLGGRWLVDGATAVATSLGLSRVFVGLVLVGIGTSAPELAFGIGAALTDHGDLVAGNVLGSNIVNIGLAWGLAILIRRMPAETNIPKVDALILMLVTAFAVWCVADGSVSRLEGGLLLSAAIGTIALSFWRERSSPATADSADGSDSPAKRSMLPAALKVIAGLVSLVLGADLLVKGAVGMAGILGVSEAVIALTVTAVGTGIPELVVTAMAAYRREFELAVGNVIGSNIMNLGLVLGMSSLVTPLQGITLGLVPFAAVVLFTAVFLVLLRLKLMSRIAGAGLLLAYLAYTILAVM